MQLTIFHLVLLPYISCLLMLIPFKKTEKTIFNITLFSMLIELALAIGLFIQWAWTGMNPVYLKKWSLYQSGDFDFFISFQWDLTSIAFTFMGILITLIVVLFSRYYMHREDGYQRFFQQVQFFFAGYITVLLAGNMETLFIGWEFVGLISFLLISYFRKRYLPVKNALKVVSVYRLGDVLLIVSMWLVHHLWKGSVSFQTFSNKDLLASIFAKHPMELTMIVLMIFVAAFVKSGVFPFSYWVPRAMEGPTVSSALFYGALSIHLGLFLLLRTQPLWATFYNLRIVLGCIGLLSAWVCHSIALYQPTVKTQIAYASLAQIGLIVVEISLGLTVLPILHIIGNAFFRTYQLLVSPSVLSYLSHLQVYNAPRPTFNTTNKWRNTWYVLAVKEFNLDNFKSNYFWRPFKKIGLGLGNASQLYILMGVSMAIFFTAGMEYFNINFPEFYLEWMRTLAPWVGLAWVLVAFSTKANSKNVLLIAFMVHLLFVVAVSHDLSSVEITVYLICLAIFLTFALYAIIRLSKKGLETGLENFQGLFRTEKSNSIIYLLGVLGLIGFPISPLFIGIDYMLVKIEHHEVEKLFPLAISLLMLELALLRSYLRIFGGLASHGNGPEAFRSS